MSPKRKKTTTTHSAKKDSTYPNSSQLGKETNNANSSRGAKRHKTSTDNMTQIDYDLLAEAIIRKQNSAPTEVPLLSGQETSHGEIISSSPSNEIPIESTSQPSIDVSAPTASTLPQPSASVTHRKFNAKPANDFTSLLNQLFSGEMGASTESTVNVNPPLSLDEGIPLGANTPSRLKQKIWSDQFFDFNSLLPNHKESTISIQIQQYSLSFSNPTPSKASNLLSIEQWTNAFHIFMAIYIEKKPQDAPHLLKYISTIREIASSNGDAA